VRYLVVIVLMGCAAKQAVVKWATVAPTTTERIELRSSGEGSYTKTTDGVPASSERVSLSPDQLAELAELFRTQKACQLAHDPAYTPAPDEGQTTLELAFPDQHCTVVLWNTEWQRGSAKEITETMRSMRPLRRSGPAPDRLQPHR